MIEQSFELPRFSVSSLQFMTNNSNTVPFSLLQMRFSSYLFIAAVLNKKSLFMVM